MMKRAGFLVFVAGFLFLSGFCVMAGSAAAQDVEGVSEGYAGDAGVSSGSVYPDEGDAGVPPSDDPLMGGPVAQCPHQDWVGKNIRDINLKAITTRVRVLYPDSMVTEDYSPDRLNIMLEKGTDTITAVTCG